MGAFRGNGSIKLLDLSESAWMNGWFEIPV